MSAFAIIDADAHVSIPENLFAERFPASLQNHGDMLEKYPDIRFAFLESGCGWAPYWVRRLDDHLRNRKPGHIPASQMVRGGADLFWL